MKSNTTKNKKLLAFFISQICLLIFIVLIPGLPWLLKSYPVQHPYSVFFVLSSNCSGNDSGTVSAILHGFVYPAIVIFFLLDAELLFFYKRFKKIDIFKFTKFSALLMAAGLLFTFMTLKMYTYPFISLKVYGPSHTTKFYKDNFIDYKDLHINAPEKKRNLILIFMESMESSYTDKANGGVFDVNPIPNLTRLANSNINFSETRLIGGGYNLELTSWTSAGILSKTMAIPYFNPFYTIDGAKYCVRGALGLGDILKSQGYDLVFGMGSEKTFEDRDVIFENHGFEVHDINYYKANSYIPEDYRVFWGFEDQKLFSIAKKELSSIAESSKITGKPFCYGFLTVDTHFPHGFVCTSCEKLYDEQMLNVLHCSDKHLGSLVDWIQTQDWYKDTTIVIMGDHAYMDAPLNNFITKESHMKSSSINRRRRFMNIIINPYKELPAYLQKGRSFSSFDMMPTIIEALGNDIEEDGIALGRSLFSEKPTLMELYGPKDLQKAIMKKDAKYEALKS